MESTPQATRGFFKDLSVFSIDNHNNTYHRHYWTKELRCSKEELRMAVMEAGISVEGSKNI
jgi:hypothetical protein